MNATVEARFAEWLKTVRAEDGMSQRAIAEALNAQGFTAFRQTTIAKIEGGSRPVLLTEAVAMAELFGTTLDVALGLRPRKPKQGVDAQALARRTRVLQKILGSIEAELGGDA